MNYYPHHIGDYARDTAHLSMLEDAAYRRMLDLYYATERPLTLDRIALCRLVRARSKEERKAVDTVLCEFFSEGPSGWVQGRCDIEIERQKQRAHTAKENGKTGGRPRTQQEPSDNPAGSERVSQTKANQKPKPKPKNNNTGSAFAPPEWIPLEAWQAWLEMRSAKRAKNTPFALGLAVKELDALRGQGFGVQAVIEQSVLRSWTAFYPLKTPGPMGAAALAPVALKCALCSGPITGAKIMSGRGWMHDACYERRDEVSGTDRDLSARTM